MVSYAENSIDSRSTLPKPLACKELEVVSDCQGLVDFAIIEYRNGEANGPMKLLRGNSNCRRTVINPAHHFFVG